MLRTAAALLLILGTAACARPPAKDAASAVQGFLTAVQAGDAERFEAAVDRAAVREDLRRQLSALARENGLEVDGGPSDLALDRMIGPDAVRQVQSEAGGPAPAQATSEELKPLLKTAANGAVCLHDATPQARCLLTFAHQKAANRRPAAWRLVAMQAPDQTIDVGVDVGG
jgi:hypothetical protein